MERGENRLRGPRPAGYAVAWCPDFRLQAVRRRAGGGLPAILVDDSLRQSVVLCANREAGHHGISPGMPAVQAIARCPGLRVERPSAAAEGAAGRMLLEGALAWVPGVEETEPGLLTLDLSTQAPELWVEGGRELRGRLAAAGLDVAVGLGPTSALARIAAHVAHHRGHGVWHLAPGERLAQLDRLPLALAGIAAELEEKLAACGLRTLGAFARLDRAGVAARFGAGGLELWLRLAGTCSRPLDFARLEELFECRGEFETELCEREPLCFLLRRFLEELVVRVGRCGRAAAAVHLLLCHADGSCYGRRLALPEPALDVEVLFRLAAGHLETVEMRSAVVGLQLRLETTAVEAAQRALFGAGLSDRHRCEQTLARVRKIVGADRVGSPRPLDSHRPGRFERAPLRAELETAETLFGPTPGKSAVPGRGVGRVGSSGAGSTLAGSTLAGSTLAGSSHSASTLAGSTLAAPAPAGSGAARGECRVPADPGGGLCGPPATGLFLRRYPLPCRASVLRQGGRIRQVESARVSGPVVACQGPWRCDGDWWHRGRAWERVEWDVEVRDRGLFRLLETAGGWLVEGYYD